MRRYEGMAAIVTGAGSGIGRATAERLADEGAAVAIVDIDGGAAEAAAAAIAERGATAIARRLDVSDRAEYEVALAEVEDALGPVRVLVNNAAVGGAGAVTAWDEEVVARAFAVNVKGVMHGMGVVGAAMAAGAGGSIVNIASMAGTKGLPGLTPYTMTKGAVVALTRSAAMELAPRVRVNAIAPGKVITPFREQMFGPLSDEERATMEAFYPLQIVGMPEDIAAAVAFLASDDARFITGIVLPVDGGRTAGFHEVPI